MMFPMVLRLTDTLTNTERPLAPISPDRILRIYVCGITPYAESHVGHALHAIVFDVLRRYLEWRPAQDEATPWLGVKHVQNFTDIDDKLIDRSQRLGISMLDLADQNIEAYFRQLTAMNVLPATEYPRVTQLVPNIVRFIEGLVAKGAAYESGGDVYYRVRSKNDYGKLSKRDINDLLSGARVDASELKDDPLDFALWKTAKPGEPSWESPWGQGRPGWHIECSVMSYESLGEQIDIHGGGADLIFPHHENEIAQTESYTGRPPFANFWMHNALLQLGSDKMSKSIGNMISIGEVLERFGGDALRMFVITSHYRSPSTYSDEALEASAKGAERLREAAFGGSSGESLTFGAAAVRNRFMEAMDLDLNTPRALAVLFELARDINRERTAGNDTGGMQRLLRQLAGVLGFNLEAPAQKKQEAAPFIDLLVELRRELRTAKQYQLADSLRDRLVALGVELRDSSEGTDWTLR